MQRIIGRSLLFFLLFLIFICGQAFAAGNSPDIAGHWAEKQVTQWTNKGLVKGYEDGTFKPNSSISRAEFMTMVNRAFGLKEEAAINIGDVTEAAWYHGEIAKAVKAGYIKGDAAGLMNPSRQISRQEAAVILFRLLELNEDKGNRVVGAFKDVGAIASWSKEEINAIVQGGYLGGYPDQSFRPTANITRAETVTVLDRVVGELYDKAGTYGPASGKETINSNVTVNTTGITLRNMLIKGDLLLTAGIGQGDARLVNVTVEGRTVVTGGGEESIIFEDSSLGIVIMKKEDGKVRIALEGSSSALNITIKAGGKVEITGEDGKIVEIDIESDDAIELSGNFDTVNIEKENAKINFESGTITNLNIGEGASGTSVTGDGNITRAFVSADANIEKAPGQTYVKEGATANVGGQNIEGDKTDEEIEETKQTEPTPPAPTPTPPAGGGGGASVAPTVAVAETNTAGDMIILEFNKAMSEAANHEGSFKFKVDGGAERGIVAAATDSTPDNHRVLLVIFGAPIENGDSVTVSYTAGTFTALDGRLLASFTNRAVTNNVPSSVPAAPTAGDVVITQPPPGANPGQTIITIDSDLEYRITNAEGSLQKQEWILGIEIPLTTVSNPPLEVGDKIEVRVRAVPPVPAGEIYTHYVVAEDIGEAAAALVPDATASSVGSPPVPATPPVGGPFAFEVTVVNDDNGDVITGLLSGDFNFETVLTGESRGGDTATGALTIETIVEDTHPIRESGPEGPGVYIVTANYSVAEEIDIFVQVDGVWLDEVVTVNVQPPPRPSDEPTFEPEVRFGSIFVDITNLLDENGVPYDGGFSEFYDLLDKDLSGLKFYKEGGGAPDIFYSFNQLEANVKSDFAFDNTTGEINILGDIELNSIAFAEGGSFENFEVFEHDRASIRARKADGAWDVTKAAAVPYLSFVNVVDGNNLKITVSGNEAYGDGELAFLPEFGIAGAYAGINIKDATGANYILAKAEAVSIGDFGSTATAAGEFTTWYVFVDDHSEGADNLATLTSTLDEATDTFTISATRASGETINAAITLYIMDGTIGTIQYEQVRLFGTGAGTDVAVSAISGSGDVTTVTTKESHYTVTSHGAELGKEHNTIVADETPITTATLVGQFLDNIEKGYPTQAWKVTTAENVPASAAVFGPATAKDPATDTLVDGDVLTVLSSDWSTIRSYTITVTAVLTGISGVVTSSIDGSPLADVNVRISPTQEDTTNASGEYAIIDVAPGTSYISLYADFFYHSQTPYEVTIPSIYNTVMQPAGKIAGAIILEGTLPEGTYIKAQISEHNNLDDAIVAGPNFTVRGVPVGTKTLSFYLVNAVELQNVYISPESADHTLTSGVTLNSAGSRNSTLSVPVTHPDGGDDDGIVDIGTVKLIYSDTVE